MSDAMMARYVRACCHRYGSSAAAAASDRNIDMFRARASGATWIAVGRRFGVSATRVLQVVARAVVLPDDVRRARAADKSVARWHRQQVSRSPARAMACAGYAAEIRGAR